MAFTIYPFIFATKEEKQNKGLMNHERIHLAQYKELYWIGFLICYFGHSLYLLCRHLSLRLAYMLNTFEIEAYTYGKDLNYLNHRIKFAWRKRYKPMNNYIKNQKDHEPDFNDRLGAVLLLLGIAFVIYVIVALIILS